MRRIAPSLALVLVLAACGGDEGEAATTTVTTAPPATTTTAPASTTTATTAATTTTTAAPTTTTTTIPAAPAIVWGEPFEVVALGDPVVAGAGALIEIEFHAVASPAGAGFLVAASRDEAGPWRNLGGFEQRDAFTDVALWAVPPGGEPEPADPPGVPGSHDEWAEDLAAFEGTVVAAGRWRPSGSTAVDTGFGTEFVTEPTAAALWVLGDGWARVDDPDLDAEGDDEIRGLAVWDGTLVAAGVNRFRAEGALFTETSPVVWVAARDQQDGEAGQPVTGPDLEVTRVDLPDRMAGIDAVVAGDGALIAAGWSGDSGAVWRSQDGTAWEPVWSAAFSAGDTVRIHDLAASPAGMVAVGQRFGDERVPMAWFSPDGIEWVEVPLPVSLGELHSVAAFDGGLLAVGRSADLTPLALVSADGRAWEEAGATLPLPEGAEAVYLGVAGGAGSTVLVAGVVRFPGGTRLALIWEGVPG